MRSMVTFFTNRNNTIRAFLSKILWVLNMMDFCSKVPTKLTMAVSPL